MRLEYTFSGIFLLLLFSLKAAAVPVYTADTLFPENDNAVYENDNAVYLDTLVAQYLKAENYA